MRRSLAMLAVVAAALPAAPAHAIYCGELDPVCRLVCEINQALDRPCLR